MMNIHGNKNFNFGFWFQVTQLIAETRHVSLMFYYREFHPYDDVR